MRDLKLMLAVAAIVSAGTVGTTSLAKAQDYAQSIPGCVPHTSTRWWVYDTYYPNYFVANWEPFFRHHYYRYGPIVNCLTVGPAPVVSANY
jgi:hypothetical protein